ncbi:MAG: thioredoxin family protein, partial [Odoribacter sp.]|nr:thioredoxin family protein [Odoribacter sp.]
MKRSLALLSLFILIVGSVYAQGIEFFHGTYEEALQKARTEGKQIFVDVYTSWCGPCKMMAKNVFTCREVGDYYNSKFVCLKLDAEKENTHAFFNDYQANGYPSFFWLDAQGNLLETRTGFASPEDFIRYAKEAVKSDFNVRLEAGRIRWESGERS